MDYLRRSKGPENPVTDTTPTGTDPSYTSLRLIDSDIEPAQPQEACRKQKTVSRKQLVNKLNHTHFKQNRVRILFENIEDSLSVQKDALPHPCFGKYLACLWTGPVNDDRFIRTHIFKELQVFTEEDVISVAAQVRAISSRGICLKLPESCIQHSSRKATRYACKPLDVQLIQNGVIFNGTLMDFSAFAFRVEIRTGPAVPLHWMNTSSTISLVVKNEEETLYAGDCRIIKHDEGVRRKNLVLSPLKESIQRFSPRAHRSRRTTLSPSPDIAFRHPLTDKLVTLKVLDISGSGVAVEDDEENSMLVAGLVIPSMTLNFANSFQIDCRAQVVYRRVFKTDENRRIVKCGIAFLDVPAGDHMKLLSMLHQAENKCVYVCSRVETEDLWRFFFETGFIYPKKYAFLHPHRDQIKKTYETLYCQNSNIARHFTWQQKGRILAHLSMLRFYEKTWLIHHLAARTAQRPGAALEVLDQIGSFTYDSHRLQSSHMDYLICYFRPNNRFPNHFFGGIAKGIQNPKACSIDAFVYTHYRISNTAASLPESWTLDKPEYDDLIELEKFYEHHSGGLMLQSLDLVPDDEMSDRFSLVSDYQELGFARERRIYALKCRNRLAAVVMVNISDLALNLSDLTNCISFFVLDETLPTDVLERTMAVLRPQYNRTKLPVLLYPAEYAQRHDIAHDRKYHLWTLSMQHTDDYFKHYEKLR